MTVASVSSNSSPAPAHSAVPARAPDGDYKARNVLSSQTKDIDGDYKPSGASAAAQSSAGVQAKLTSLKPGG